MLKDYISVDIENPNSRGNSICSIGIIVVKNNKVVNTIYSLINPEDRFDMNNSEITGLCYSDVKNAPNFKEYWNNISALFEDNIIVGHNIIYDLNVISKSLERYEINVPKMQYYCTLNLSRRFLKLNSYSLDNVCKNLNIKLINHHNASADAKATQEIFEYINDKYDIGKPQNFEYEYKLAKNLNSKLETNINLLYGIIKGISYDEVIDEDEINTLKKWIEENRLYKHYEVFNSIINKLEKILEDNVITKYEQIQLINLVSNIKRSKIYNETTLNLQILNGILEGITCNKKINSKEIQNLSKWLEENDYLKDVYPYDKVLFEVNKVIEDGIITDEECNYLFETFQNVVNPKSSECSKNDFYEKTFCLTGEFESMSKSEVSKKIQALGGIEKNGVSSKLNYLIVGSVGSDAWKYGKIGGKQAKAQELNEKGATIKIVDEHKLNDEILN